MSRQFIHDGFQIVATGVYSILAAGPLVVGGSLLWSEINGIARPEGGRRSSKLSSGHVQSR